jgi:hypothetical protein
MNTVKTANKIQMKRVAKMLNEFFGQTRFADAVIDGNTIAWEGNYEWNEKFNAWFHNNKSFFNCGNLWYENQNGYSISVYCG